MTNILYNTILTDMETGYKVFRREVIEGMNIGQNDSILSLNSQPKYSNVNTVFSKCRFPSIHATIRKEKRSG